jgi:hypothetical protein
VFQGFLVLGIFCLCFDVLLKLDNELVKELILLLGLLIFGITLLYYLAELVLFLFEQLELLSDPPLVLQLKN